MNRRSVALAVSCSALFLVACTHAAVVPDGPRVTASNASDATLLPVYADELPSMDVTSFHQLLAQLEGTPIVVNVWASWCGPCVREFPLLAKASLDHPDIQFVGVDIQDSRGGAVSFIRDHGVRYPSLFDPTGAIAIDLDGIAPPITIFYDAAGHQVARVDGEIGQDTLDADLAKIGSIPN